MQRDSGRSGDDIATNGLPVSAALHFEDRLAHARRLLRLDLMDEDVERLAGVTLTEIVVLRAVFAAAAFHLKHEHTRG